MHSVVVVVVAVVDVTVVVVVEVTVVVVTVVVVVDVTVVVVVVVAVVVVTVTVVAVVVVTVLVVKVVDVHWLHRPGHASKSGTSDPSWISMRTSRSQKTSKAIWGGTSVRRIASNNTLHSEGS